MDTGGAIGFTALHNLRFRHINASGPPGRAVGFEPRTGSGFALQLELGGRGFMDINGGACHESRGTLRETLVNERGAGYWFEDQVEPAFREGPEPRHLTEKAKWWLLGCTIRVRQRYRHG